MLQAVINYISIKSMFLCWWFMGALLLQSTVLAQEKTASELPDKQNTDNQQTSTATNSDVVPQSEPDLSMFIESVLKQNTELRKKNSQTLFAKLVNKKETGLLPIEVYKSLGFRLREPFLVQTPEISTRFYTIADDSNLYFQQLFDLEKTWALLSTTLSRVSLKDDFSELIDQNVALDSVDLWYRVANNQQYNQWLIELKNQIKIAGKNIELNKDEFSESDFGKMKIKNLELLSDNTQLMQFFDTESAYLFTRSGARNLPKNRKNPLYDFSKQAFCSPNIDLSEKGILYLKTNHPDVLDAMDHESLRQQIWNLFQNAREFSKKLLLDPENQQLKAVNYVLSDFTLNLILQLNHKRLNAYATNQSEFFSEQSKNTFPYEPASRLSEFINFQNEIYGSKVLDSFIAAERVASMNLQLLRDCVQLYDDKQSTKRFAQTAESQRFLSLNYPEATNVEGSLNQIVTSWDGSNYSRGLNPKSESAAVAKNSVPAPQAVKKQSAPQVVKSQSSKIRLTKTSESTSTRSDSIIGVNSDRAAVLLINAGFELSSHEEVLELTSTRGYSIQVLTTSSASEAAAKARRMTQFGEVKVYLSSVNVNGVIENRYKVLVMFQKGRISAAKYAELSAKANEIRGYVKRYKQIRKDAKAPDSTVTKSKVVNSHSSQNQIVENTPVKTTQFKSTRSTPINLDSIISASSEQAAKLLKKEGFVLSSYDEIIGLTNDKGYSIQVLTTSSASEAAAKALRLSKTEQVKVYLSSVKIDGIVEKRYKILVTFLPGPVSDEKTGELKIKAKQLKGFLKPYRSIRKDLIR